MTRPRLDVDLRLLGASLASLAAGLIVLFLTRGPATVETVVAARPLPPGVALGSLPLETVRVSDPGGAILSTDIATVAGMVLTAPLDTGDPILWSLLSEPEASRRNVIGLTLRPEQAVHGTLVAGDRVAVYAMRDDLPPHRLAPSVLVLSADAAGAGFGAGDVAVLLEVDERLTRQLVRSIHDLGVYLVKVNR